MTAQIFLTLLLFVVILYAWVATSRAPAIGVIFGLVALLALYFVWLPSHAIAIAHKLGIGRGVDLALYVWVIFSGLAILNLHLSNKALLDMITELSRRIAISEAISRVPGDEDINDSGPS